LPNLHAGGPPLVSCDFLFNNTFTATLIPGGLLLHAQIEDTPFQVDKGSTKHMIQMLVIKSMYIRIATYTTFVL
jgi:hypothetical protein